jgi:DNA-binding CsgD family transcriptional regulator
MVKKKDALAQSASLIGEAARNPDYWPVALNAIERYLCVENVNLVILQGGTTGISSFKASSLADDVLQNYQENFPQGDVWIDALKTFPTQSVYKSGYLYSNRKLVDTRFYEEFLKPINLFHCAGGFFENREGNFGMLSALLPMKAGEFDNDRIERMQKIFKLLRSAINASSEISSLKMSLDLSNKMLDSQCIALGLVTLTGRLLYANHLFERQLRFEKIMKLKNGKVFFLHEGTRGWLCTQLNKVAKKGEVDPACFEKCLHDDHFNDVRVSLSVPDGIYDLLPGDSHTAILISIHGLQGQQEVVACLRSIGVSPVAALVGQHLVMGRSAREISILLNASYETVRSHLKCLMRHFGVSSQRQLIATLNGLLR